jgi:hypothetical protein
MRFQRSVHEPPVDAGSASRQSLRLALRAANAQARRRTVLVGWALGLMLYSALGVAGVMLLRAMS